MNFFGDFSPLCGTPLETHANIGAKFCLAINDLWHCAIHFVNWSLNLQDHIRIFQFALEECKVEPYFFISKSKQHQANTYLIIIQPLINKFTGSEDLPEYTQTVLWSYQRFYSYQLCYRRLLYIPRHFIPNCIVRLS